MVHFERSDDFRLFLFLDNIIKHIENATNNILPYDVPNIEERSKEDVIYKGQIIGQRIIIFYRDGSWKYNNAT